MNVFTYGSLMYRPVWDRVVSREYAAVAALLRGYARRRIRGEIYPALRPGGAESTVRGVVYLGVTPDDLSALDRFEDEGDAYSRIEVPVELADGRTVQAATYLYREAALVEESLWEPDRFETSDLRVFLDRYCRGVVP